MEFIFETFAITFQFIITWAVIIIMILTLIFEDKLNGLLQGNMDDFREFLKQKTNKEIQKL